MLFYLKKKLLFIKRKLRSSSPVISNGGYSVFSLPEGFKIFTNKKEITKNCGLGFSWLDKNNKFSDLTKIKPKNLLWTESIIKNRYSVAKINIDFNVNFENSSEIFFIINYNFAKEINSIKIPLFLPLDYTYWLLDYHEGIFPSQKGVWQDVPTPLKEGGTSAGVRDKNDFPVIILEVKGATHLLENSENTTKARVLSAIIDKPLRAGEINGVIKLLNKDNFSIWLNEKRSLIKH